MDELFLPGVPVDLVRQAFAAAPGNEITGGKFASPESSTAMAAHTFGFFLNRTGDLPLPPECKRENPSDLSIETEVNIP